MFKNINSCLNVYMKYFKLFIKENFSDFNVMSNKLVFFCKRKLYRNYLRGLNCIFFFLNVVNNIDIKILLRILFLM